MGIPGDRDRLSMKIIRDVEGSAHTRSTTSLHHDAMMRPWPPGIAAPVALDPPRRRAESPVDAESARETLGRSITPALPGRPRHFSGSAWMGNELWIQLLILGVFLSVEKLTPLFRVRDLPWGGEDGGSAPGWLWGVLDLPDPGFWPHRGSCTGIPSSPKTAGAGRASSARPARRGLATSSRVCRSVRAECQLAPSGASLDSRARRDRSAAPIDRAAHRRSLHLCAAPRSRAG